jgi:glycine/D-amino acid oxidase-like deaminating enzyme
LSSQSSSVQFAELPESKLVPNSVAGITYDSVNTDVPAFLPYLLSLFLAKGGRMVRGSVTHIDQVISGGAGSFTGTESEKTAVTSPPDAVVVCLGLGARFLGGVEDKDVYPVRGQTILIRAPWIKRCMSLSGGASRIWTYVIPRRSGDVIIGGTYEANDWCDNLFF